MTPEVANLTLRDLEYIIAIAEQRSFRLAARDCAVSQPALSTQVKKVEQSLDIQIFERTNREVLVTQVGEEIVEQCRCILEELETLGTIARGVDKPLTGPFRLGVVSSLCSYLMPHLIAPLHKLHPKLELILRESFYAEILESLRIGKLDAVIGPVPIPTGSGRFESYPLFREPLLLGLHKQDPLSRRKSVALNQNCVEKLLFLDEQHSITQLTFDYMRSRDLEPPTQPIFSTSIESICIMIQSTQKQAVLPLLACETGRDLPSLTYHPFTRPTPYRDIGLIWRPRYRGKKSLLELAPHLSQMALSVSPKLVRLK